MFVKAINKGYYNKVVIEPDTIFDYCETLSIPVWVEVCETKTTNNCEIKNYPDLKVSELPEDKKADIIKRAKETGITSNINNYKVETIEKKIASQLKNSNSNTELLEELEALRTEALDKDIVIDITGMSTAEEIAELKKVLIKE